MTYGEHRQILEGLNLLRAFQVALVTKNLPMQEEQETWVQSLVQEDPLEKENAKPAPVFLPEKFHEQRSLVGYSSPWGCKELDMTEQINTQF